MEGVLTMNVGVMPKTAGGLGGSIRGAFGIIGCRQCVCDKTELCDKQTNKQTNKQKNNIQFVWMCTQTDTVQLGGKGTKGVKGVKGVRSSFISTAQWRLLTGFHGLAIVKLSVSGPSHSGPLFGRVNT